MKIEKIIRYFLVGLVFIIGFSCLGVYFKLEHWIKWIFFAVGYVLIILPALDYWNEKLKDKL